MGYDYSRQSFLDTSFDYTVMLKKHLLVMPDELILLKKFCQNMATGNISETREIDNVTSKGALLSSGRILFQFVCLVLNDASTLMGH